MGCWQQRIQDSWYRQTIAPGLWLLWPLAAMYAAAVSLRRRLYKYQLLRSYKLPVPTIVVGNITVGGTGKTPLVIYLLELLQQQGLRPGVISRGYLGKSRLPTVVAADASPAAVGDEPLLIAQRSNCPVVVAKSKVAAGQYLIKHFAVDVIISDDGLQHYQLQRDIEIVVIDGNQRFGNGHCLPMGPLRESPQRLPRADMVVINNGIPANREFAMQTVAGRAYNLADRQQSCALAAFVGRELHAVAGIGAPGNFFRLLQSHGLQVIAHPFADHHNFTLADLDFSDQSPIIMTEKDAVKCRAFAKSNYWCLPIAASLSQEFAEKLLLLLKSVHSKQANAKCSQKLL